MLILAQAAEESKFFGSQADWTRGKVLRAQKYRGPHEGDTQLDRGDRSSFTHCSLKYIINNIILCIVGAMVFSLSTLCLQFVLEYNLCRILFKINLI